MKDWMATPFIFDRWRERYDDLTWEEQVEFYNEVARRWPSQNNYPLDWFKSCLAYIDGTVDRFSVLEIGGWTGELARRCLDEFSEIAFWYNYEVCEWAVENQAFRSLRYRTMVPKDFPWKIELPGCYVFVTSHTLEHIKMREVEALFENLPDSIKFMAHVLPGDIGDNGRMWLDYGGAHILECGWNTIDDFASGVGFSPVKKFDGVSRRLYQR